MAILSGQVIKGYELHEQVGAGGQGEVYRAYQPSLKREVAIKVILPQYANQPEFIRRFDAEALTIARLEHPYIVPLYDYWRDENGAFLVMRWLRGGNLRDSLQSGPLSGEAILRVVDQVGAALASAHRSGVVHRDFKPENVLLDEDGNAYLSDFGIAIDVNSAENARVTQVEGSLFYMSPEQVRGDPVTPGTDIYSLGIVLYELLTGQHPLAGLQRMQIPHHHLLKPMPSVCSLRPDLSSGIDEVIQKATAKAAADRFPDAVSLAAALRQQFMLDVATPDSTARVYERAEAIPNQPHRLIGRDALLEQIRQSLDLDGRVLLNGFGGIGKTALATVTAVEHINAGKGAVIWLEIGTDNADLSLEAIGRGLGEGQAVASKTGQDRVEAVRALLENRQALLVLDNAWNDQALFHTLKAIPPHIPTLITSRHAIPIDGTLIDVAELSDDAALELLSYHAGKSYAASDDARALCRQLGYHTFALEIAGKILKIEQRLTPARLISRIAGAPHDLRVPGSFADVGRESLKDLIDDSVNELSPPQRSVFTLMGGMFAPRASLTLLTNLVGGTEPAAETLVAELQQRGLAELIYAADGVPDHYRLHDLTYSYARALYRSRNANHQPVIDAVRRFVETFADDYDRLDFEQNNVLEAARSAHEEGDDDTLIDLMTRLNVSGNYFASRGHTPRSLALMQQAIDAAAQKRQVATTHYLWSRLGNAYANYLGDLDKALSAYQEAARLAVLMGDTRRQAQLLGAIGTVRARQGAGDADDYLQAGYRLAKQHNDDLALSQILEYLGYNAVFKQNYEIAHKYYSESLAVAERLQQDERLFFALTNLAAAENALERHSVALSLSQRALEVGRRNHHQLWVAYALEGMGEAYHALQDRQQAQHYFEQALALFCQLGVFVRITELKKLMQAGNYVIPPDCLEGDR